MAAEFGMTVNTVLTPTPACIPPANKRATARFAAALLASAAYPPVPLLYDARAARHSMDRLPPFA
jgi:hypothetical protein